MTRRRLGPDDKTPSQPVRLLSATTLNLLSLAADAARMARSFEQATDAESRIVLGHQLAHLGGEFVRAGNALVREAKK